MKKLTKLQQRVLKEWNKTKVVHPSYRQIAKKLGCSTSTVFSAIKKIEEQQNNE